MMIVQILDKSINIEKNNLSVGAVIDKITELIAESAMIFDYLIINDTEIYEDFENYMNQHLDAIDRIQIVVRSFQEVLNDTLRSVVGYLDRAYPEVEKLAKEFYQNPSGDTWQCFEQLLEGLQWLTEMVEEIQAKMIVCNYSRYQIISKDLSLKLTELSYALENVDYILIADTLTYEFLPLLEALKTEVLITLKGEVSQDDLN